MKPLTGLLVIMMGGRRWGVEGAGLGRDDITSQVVGKHESGARESSNGRRHLHAHDSARHPKVMSSAWSINRDNPELHEAFYEYGSSPALERVLSFEEAYQEHGNHRRQSGRDLQSLVASPSPRFDPCPGAYSTAVGVAVIAEQGYSISVTLSVVNDTLHPNGTTVVVQSGAIVHVDRSATVTAYTLRLNGSSNADSAAITGRYDIPFRQYGSGYLVPHHDGRQHSGRLVRVNLRTDLLSYVRIHNALTDFADYYSTNGIGPYGVGHLHVNDLSTIDPDLKGFQGGFSGTCNGQHYGFLSPFFSGTKYEGKAVRITADNYVDVLSGSKCNATSTSTCAVSILDFATVDSNLTGFAGGFMSGCWTYFVPYFNGFRFSSRVVRVHAQNFTAANVTFINLRRTDPALGGFFGGFAHGDYGYLAPFRNVRGPVGHSNTRFTCDGYKNVDMVSTQATNGGDHLQPSMFGKLVRFKLSNFSSYNVEVLDLTTYDPDLRGFSGAFAVGNQGILVPYRNHELPNNQGFFSKVIKVDLDDFETVHILDLSHVDQSLRGFVGGFAYGKYAVLVPSTNGRVRTNWQRRAEFGTVVRIDVDAFNVAHVKLLDLSKVYRQQIPSRPMPQLRGFMQGFASGRHAFFVPYHHGARSGLLTRVDMADFDRLADLQAHGNSTDTYGELDGVQVVDLAQHDPWLVGFSGGFAIPE